MNNNNLLAKNFVEFAINNNVLKFGEFITKAKRKSPYFFNAGLFSNGKILGELSNFFAKTILNSKIEFDMLFGSAYKGIPLAAATSIAIYQLSGKICPFAYNRKEAKDHGEGGVLVGELNGKVLIIDDVISAGTSVRESVELIQKANAIPVGVAIALDRQERGLGELLATQEVEQTYKFPVISIACVDNIVNYLSQKSGEVNCHPDVLDNIKNYRKQYGNL